MSSTRASPEDPVYDANSIFRSQTPSSLRRTPDIDRNGESQNAGRSRHTPLIKEQREQLKALDVEDREDLAKHLYVTWLLQKQYKSSLSRINNEAYEKEIQASQTRGRLKGKRIARSGTFSEPLSTDRQLSNDGEENSSILFHLPRRWHAWPLPAHQVPRTTNPAESSTIVLREALQAILLRQASRTLRSRSEKHTMSSDDLLAEELCRPVIKEVLRKFDKLLVSLYKNRQGYSQYQEHSIRDEGRTKSSYMKMKINMTMKQTRKRSTMATVERADDDEDSHLLEAEVHDIGKEEQVKKEVNAKNRQASLRLMTSTNIIHQACIQGWSPSILHATGSRLSQLFPTSQSLGYVQCLEEPNTPLFQCNLWGQPATPLPPIIGFHNFKHAPSLEQVTIAGEVIRVNTLNKWKEEDLILQWRAEGGAVASDGFLEEIPGKKRCRSSKYEEARKKRKEKVYNARKEVA